MLLGEENINNFSGKKTMKAFEFLAKMKNGAIEVPKNYIENVKKGGQLRVIVLVDEVQKPKKTLTKKALRSRFKAVRLDTRGFKFNREEANER